MLSIPWPSEMGRIWRDTGPTVMPEPSGAGSIVMRVLGTENRRDAGRIVMSAYFVLCNCGCAVGGLTSTFAGIPLSGALIHCSDGVISSGDVRKS